MSFPASPIRLEYGGPRNRHRFFCFYDSTGHQRRLVGITTLIPRKFFHRKWTHLHIAGVSGKKKKVSGSERGSLIDKQITHWANLVINAKSKRSLTAIDRFVEKTHPYTKKFIYYLRANGWTPVAAQLPVGDTHRRVATALDLVVRDLKQRLILLEIKAGYNQTFDRQRWNGCVQRFMYLQPESLKRWVANAKTYSMIELLWGARLYASTFPQKPADRFYVIHLDDQGVHPYNIEPQLGKAVLEFLHSEGEQWKVKRAQLNGKSRTSSSSNKITVGSHHSTSHATTPNKPRSSAHSNKPLHPYLVGSNKSHKSSSTTSNKDIYPYLVGSHQSQSSTPQSYKATVYSSSSSSSYPRRTKGYVASRYPAASIGSGISIQSQSVSVQTFTSWSPQLLSVGKECVEIGAGHDQSSSTSS